MDYILRFEKTKEYLLEGMTPLVGDIISISMGGKEYFLVVQKRTFFPQADKCICHCKSEAI